MIQKTFTRKNCRKIRRPMICGTGNYSPLPLAFLQFNTLENKPLDIQSDFRDLLKLFNSHHVEYLVVGSYALAFHGAPRYTGDIDIYINPTADNILNKKATGRPKDLADIQSLIP